MRNNGANYETLRTPSWSVFYRYRGGGHRCTSLEYGRIRTWPRFDASHFAHFELRCTVEGMKRRDEGRTFERLMRFNIKKLPRDSQ